ncbi:MAG: ribonuclease Z [Muribaculaceae bacterium]|nr:ribonuclease Z [Muribaculaceae bacterium]
MARFRINILGCGSATPSLRHLPSCQVVDFRDNLMMIDCGEGAQLSMRKMKLKFSRLNHIFISHLHGDHVLGLPGLLSTMSLHGKTGTVTIHTFREGIELLKPLVDFLCHEPSYELVWHEISPSGGTVLETPSLTVAAFPLYHRVPAVGFLMRETEKPRHIKGDMVEFHQVPVSRMAAIKAGADFVKPDGTVIPNAMLTSDADPCVSYAYCSDTTYNPKIAAAVRGVDLLYHEATYIDADAHKAHERGHATASEAARTALEAGARQLLLGHYSKSYEDESRHLAEARAIFPNTLAANEGMTIDLL